MIDELTTIAFAFERELGRRVLAIEVGRAVMVAVKKDNVAHGRHVEEHDGPAGRFAVVLLNDFRIVECPPMFDADLRFIVESGRKVGA